MRELLPGWVPPTEDLLKEYWEKGLFAVDANVLLGLYRRPKDSRTQLLTALRELDERLWVPHQAATDYMRNRLRVLTQQRTAKAQLSAALDEVASRAKGDLRQLLQQMSRKEVEPVESSFEKAFGKLRDEVLRVEERNRDSLGDSIRIDPLLDEVDAICEGKIGEPFTPERLKQIHADAQKRIEAQQPPGYADAEKPIPERYGDYVLWEQLCLKAEKIDQPLVLITDDLKEDWVWRESGQALGPRPELVAELLERCDVPFHLYSSSQFLALSTGDETDQVADSEKESPGMDDLTQAATPSTPSRRSRLPLSEQDLVQSRPNPPLPIHQFVDSGVLLGLNRHPGGMFSKIRCAVIDPAGSATATIVPSTALSVSMLGGPAVKAVYPRDFPGAALLPGLYQVIWYRINEAGYLQVGGSGEREIARDSFVIATNDPDG